MGDSAGNHASTTRVVNVIANTTPPPPTTIPTVVPAATVYPAPVSFNGFWSFIPLVKNTPTKAPAVIKPILPTRNTLSTSKSGKKDYTITRVTYLLNGSAVHISTTFPDSWQLDTSGMADGSYTLTSILQYADNRIENNTQNFIVANDSSLWQKIKTFFQDIYKKVI